MSKFKVIRLNAPRSISAGDPPQTSMGSPRKGAQQPPPDFWSMSCPSKDRLERGREGMGREGREEIGEEWKGRDCAVLRIP